MFKKIVSAFLALTFVTTLMPAGLQAIVLAQNASSQVQEEAVREELSDYLLKIVDTEGVTEIVTPDPEPPRKKARSSSLSSEEEVDPNQELILEKKDGSRVAYIFSEDIQYIDENAAVHYKEISVEKQTDDKLKKEGYDYSNGTNDYRINFSSDISKGILVDNEQVKFSLIPQNTKNVSGAPETIKTLDGDVEVFVYNGIYGEGTALRYFPQLNGLSEAIVLDKYSGQHTFTFSLNTYDLEAVLTEDNAVAFLAPDTKEEVYRLNPAYAYDNFGGEYSDDEHYTEDCTYTLEKVADGKYILTLDVSEEWLTNDNTLYPVTIDPTTSNLSSTKDAAIYSLKASTSFYKATTNCFGRTQSTYGKGRAFIRVPLPSEIKSGASISHAYLWLRETTGRTASTYVRPYMLTEGFYDTTNWNNQPSKSSTSSMTRKNINSNSTDGGPSKMWYRFDIAEAANKWTRGTTNYGVVFVSEEESKTTYNWRAFASREHATSSYHPYMVVSYTNDTKAPTITSVSGNPTAWTKGDVTLKINGASDNNGSGLHATPYSFSTTKGKYSWQAGNTKKFTANQTVYIYTRDKLGNIGLVNTTTINKIDKAMPTVTSVSGNPTAWTKNTVTLTINGAKDTGSGLHATPYSFSTKSGTYSWQASNKSSPISKNCTIYAYVRDAAGNIKLADTISITKVDTTAPTIQSVEITDHPTRGIEARILAEDKESSIKEYSFDNGKTWQTSNVMYFAERPYGMVVKVKDNVGNIASYSPDVEYPVNNPAILESDGEFTLFYPQENAIPEGHSIIMQYKIGESGTWIDYEEPFTVSPEFAVRIYAKAIDTAEETSSETVYLDVPMRIGENTLTMSDVQIESTGINMDLKRTYSSINNQWYFSFAERIEPYDMMIDGKNRVDRSAEVKIWTTQDGKQILLVPVYEKDATYYSSLDGSIITHANELGQYIVDDGELVHTFDFFGNVLSIADSLGNTISYSYEEDNYSNIIKCKVTDTVGRIYTIEYDEKQRPVQISDPANRTFSYNWTDKGLSSFTNAVGYVYNFSYANNRLVTADQQVFSYTDDGRIASVSNGQQIQTYQYDDEKNKVIIQGGSEGDISYTYADNLQIVSESGEDDSIQYTYTDSGNIATMTQNGKTTSYSYDENSNVTQISYPDETSEKFWYQNNLVSCYQDMEGQYFCYQYDADGNRTVNALVKAEDGDTAPYEYSESTPEKYTSVVRYTYDESGNVLSTTHLEPQTIDGKTSLKTVTKDEITYDEYGNEADTRYSDFAETSTQIETTSAENDVIGRPITVTDSEGNVTEYTYNANNQILSETVNGQTYSATYDTSGNLLTLKEPGQETTQYEYDDFGNLTKETLPTGLIVEYTYHEDGSKATQKIGDYIFVFANNKLTQIKVGNQILIQYTTSISGDTETVTTAYGNQHQVIDTLKSGNKISTKYNQDTSPRFEYTYTESGELKEVIDQEQKSRFVFTPSGWEQYDVSGNEPVLLYRSKTQVKNEDDESSYNGYLEEIGSHSFKNSIETGKETYSSNADFYLDRTYTKDDNGRLSANQIQKIGETNVSLLNSVYTYDESGTLSGISHTVGDNSEQTGYTYTDSGNIATITVSGQTVKYTFSFLKKA